MKKKYIYIICFMLFLQLYCQTAVPPSAGSGSVADPYQISTLDNLYWIAADSTNRHFSYIQVNDIDASETRNWFYHSDGYYLGWLPIGSEYTSRFTGIYDGQYYSIQNLYVNDRNYTGLFGYTSNAEIKNLGIKNADFINVGSDSGILIAKTYDSTYVGNCYTTGKINSSNTSNTGGLIGYLYGGSIVENCFSKADVLGKMDTGGLIGYCRKSQVLNCYSHGSILGEYYTGGLIGLLEDSTLDQCYSSCYVFGEQSKYGALIGFNRNSIVENSFWDIEISLQPNSVDGIGLTTEEMNDILNYTNAGWDFNYIWTIDSKYNTGYPFFSWQIFPKEPEIKLYRILDIGGTFVRFKAVIINIGDTAITQYGLCWNQIGSPTIYDNIVQYGALDSACYIDLYADSLTSNSEYFFRPYAENSKALAYGKEWIIETNEIDGIKPDGEGSESIPFIISNLENLLWISQNSLHWNKHYLQDSDIPASEVINWNDNNGWYPIGNFINKFSGVYDGNGHSIDSLFINGNDRIGLFGNTFNAEIKNVNLTNCNITGSSSVGSLVGENEYSIISNCSFTGNILGAGIYKGGLIGYDTKSEINKCTSSGNVNGNWYTGGIIGKCDSSYVIDCTSQSILAGGYTGTGGIIGEALYSDISKCNFAGTVTGNGEVGGITGRIYRTSISDSYNISDVSGEDNTGGISGTISTYSTISKCYNTGQIEGNSYVGGITGESYYWSNVVNSYSTGDIIMGGWVGGLIGISNGGCTTRECYSTGNVNGSSRAGGLIGQNYSSTVEQSYSYGNISGNEYVGGFIGSLGGESLVCNSYSLGNVSGTNYIGGFIGYNMSEVENCYSIGSVTGNDWLGGFIGFGDSTIVSDSFWDSEFSGVRLSMGGTGKKTSEMKMTSTYIISGWDFIGETGNGTDDIWTIDPYYNYGYPFIRGLWVEIEEDESNIPNEFILFQNYPNPFNPETTIQFALPVPGQVKLIVYNSLGQIVCKLVDSKYNAGIHSILFNADGLNSGMYFYQLVIDDIVKDSKKLLLLK